MVGSGMTVQVMFCMGVESNGIAVIETVSWWHDNALLLLG